MTEVSGMTINQRWAAIDADRALGMTAREASRKYQISPQAIRRRAPGTFYPSGDRLCHPEKPYDMVHWRHSFITQMTEAGMGPSFIGAVLRIDHSSVIHHQRGNCRCIVNIPVDKHLDKAG